MKLKIYLFLYHRNRIKKFPVVYGLLYKLITALLYQDECKFAMAVEFTKLKFHQFFSVFFPFNLWDAYLWKWIKNNSNLISEKISHVPRVGNCSLMITKTGVGIKTHPVSGSEENFFLMFQVVEDGSSDRFRLCQEFLTKIQFSTRPLQRFRVFQKSEKQILIYKINSINFLSLNLS